MNLALLLSERLFSSSFRQGGNKCFFAVSRVLTVSSVQVKYVWVSIQSPTICAIVPARRLTEFPEQTMVTDVMPVPCCEFAQPHCFTVHVSFYAMLGSISWPFPCNVRHGDLCHSDFTLTPTLEFGAAVCSTVSFEPSLAD